MDSKKSLWYMGTDQEKTLYRTIIEPFTPLNQIKKSNYVCSSKALAKRYNLTSAKSEAFLNRALNEGYVSKIKFSYKSNVSRPYAPRFI